MAENEKRTQGPEIGGQSRLDVVEEFPELYRLDLVNAGGSMPLSEPMRRKDLSRVILKLSGALRKAAVLEHQRDAVVEWARIEKFMADTMGDFAEPDYPRHLLVEEIVELRADRDAAERRGYLQALGRVGLCITLSDGLTEPDKDTLAGLLQPLWPGEPTP